jgi:hypothetical protein
MKRYIETIAVVWFPLSAHHATSLASLAPRGMSSVAVPMKKRNANARPASAPSRLPAVLVVVVA